MNYDTAVLVVLLFRSNSLPVWFIITNFAVYYLRSGMYYKNYDGTQSHLEFYGKHPQTTS